MNEVFTPLNEEKTKRLKFNMSEVEILNGNLEIRKVGLKAVVKIKNKTYKVFSKSCGLPHCNCDAYIKEI